MPRIKEQALKTELAKHGFESISIKRELPGGRVEVEANKLHPVHVGGVSRSTRPFRCRYPSGLTRVAVSSRSRAARPIRRRSRMRRAMSRRCVIADSWPPLENNSRLPG